MALIGLDSDVHVLRRIKRHLCFPPLKAKSNLSASFLSTVMNGCWH